MAEGQWLLVPAILCFWLLYQGAKHWDARNWVAPVDAHLLLEDFIRRRVRPGRHQFHAENLTIQFLREYLPENSGFRPASGEWLKHWDERAVPPKLRAIRNSAFAAVSVHLRKLDSDAKSRESEALEQKAIKVIEQHEALVQRCFEIAYRKVSAPDEYGEENPAAFEEEVKNLLVRLSEKGLGTRGHFQDYRLQARVTALLREGFQKYYTHRKANVAEHDRASIGQMTGADFELYLAALLQKAGVVDIATTPCTGDQGADLLFSWGSRRFVLQAKRYRASVGNRAIQEAHAAKGHYRGDEAWVVTSSRFTQSARALAKELGVILIDQDGLANFTSFVNERLRRC